MSVNVSAVSRARDAFLRRVMEWQWDRVERGQMRMRLLLLAAPEFIPVAS